MTTERSTRAVGMSAACANEPENPHPKGVEPPVGRGVLLATVIAGLTACSVQPVERPKERFAVQSLQTRFSDGRTVHAIVTDTETGCVFTLRVEEDLEPLISADGQQVGCRETEASQ